MKKLLLLVLALTALINPLNAVLEWAYTPLLTTSFLTTVFGVVHWVDSKHLESWSVAYKKTPVAADDKGTKERFKQKREELSALAKKKQFYGNMFFGIGIASGVAFVGLQVANRVLEKQV